MCCCIYLKPVTIVMLSTVRRLLNSLQGVQWYNHLVLFCAKGGNDCKKLFILHDFSFTLRSEDFSILKVSKIGNTSSSKRAN